MYTYLLGWKQYNKFYYGVRYSKLADTAELWVTYKTSSKHVKAFAAKHGDPDIIQIRRTFDNRERAVNWECEVLKRMSVVKDPRFLNATDNKAIPQNHNPGVNFKNARKFQDWPIESQMKLKETAKKNITELWKSGKLTGEKNCAPDNYITAAKERWADPEFKTKQKSRKWMNDGKISKMILADNIDQCLSTGWSFGRGGY